MNDLTENHMVLPYADDGAVDICPDCDQPTGRLGFCNECKDTGANMLSLTRYPGQKIIITHKASGDKIVISVQTISFAEKWVRFGLDADKTFLIDREEIHLDKQREAGL
jgi:sRNA-binding carbon storage regulator CsrA